MKTVNLLKPMTHMRLLLRGKASVIICLMSGILLMSGSCSSTDNTTDNDNDRDTVAYADRNENMRGDMGSLKPQGPRPDWAPNSLTGNMQVVLEKLMSYNAPPLESLTPAQARQQPTPTDAVMDVMKENNIPMPPPQVDTMGRDIPVSGGNVHARVYTPKAGAGPFPAIVYYHGGGWVIADLDVYDASARALAEQTGAKVISVHYRQAPEFKFPTAHNDAFAAYEWVVKNASTMDIDPARIAVAGESAGGNLACNVSIMARDKGITMPLHQLLVYPVANNDMNSASYQKNAAAKPLNKPLMEWFAKHYLPNMEASADPRISLVKANLKGLPSTTVITAEIDPLMTEGKMLADKLKDAGVEVNYKHFDGVAHEFFGMATVLPQAKEAQATASTDLKRSLNKR